jgi:uncharacterized protein YecE (DUF72 family)
MTTRKLNSVITKVGCCGFAIRGGMRNYYKQFGLVEIQSTFYNLPQIETVERWRSEAPFAFEFIPKAFQGITHPVSSPTWRKFRGKLPDADGFSSQYGFFKLTNEVVSCWKNMVEICGKLMSGALLVQSPPNFSCTSSNISNMEEFFTTADRKRIVVCWEPRGDWNQNPDEIRKVCSKLDLVHVVDIMRREPLSQHEVNYIRLHGLNQRELDYRYSYSNEELLSLKKRILAIEKKSRRVYVLFNNTDMAIDAKRFREIFLGNGVQEG